MPYKENFNENAIGSDEVGVGDYFGPLVVSAVKIKQKNLDEILKLNIIDTKLLNDNQILNLYDKLIDLVEYKTYSLNPVLYNLMYEMYGKKIKKNNFEIIKGNSNILKTNLHNLVHSNFNNKDSIHIIDAFSDMKNYKIYLNQLRNVDTKISNVILEQKAESKYIQVAVAAIFARVKFLEWWDKNLDYGQLPKGSSNEVQEFILNLYKKIGYEKLIKISKRHFIDSLLIKNNLSKDN